MAELIKGILAKASPFDATKRIVRPNGQVRYIRCVGVPFAGNQNLKKYVGSAIDVTEHELLTQELRRREAYLTEAQRLSHTGSWAWNVRTGALFWSEEIFRIYGYNPQETGPSWAQFLQEFILRIEHRSSSEQKWRLPGRSGPTRRVTFESCSRRNDKVSPFGCSSCDAVRMKSRKSSAP